MRKKSKGWRNCWLTFRRWHVSQKWLFVSTSFKCCVSAGEGDVCLWDLDWLAVPLWCCQLARDVIANASSLHPIRTCITGLRIRIRLYSSMAFKMPTKDMLFLPIFLTTYPRYTYKTSVLERSGRERSGNEWSGILNVRQWKVRPQNIRQGF